MSSISKFQHPSLVPAAHFPSRKDLIISVGTNCVKNTAIDSVKHGFKTTVLFDACRGIYKRQTRDEVISDLKNAGVDILDSGEVLK